MPPFIFGIQSLFEGPGNLVWQKNSYI